MNNENILRGLLNKYGYRKTLKYLEYAYDLRKGISLDIRNDEDTSIGLAIRTIQLLNPSAADHLDYQLRTPIEQLNDLLLTYSSLFEMLDEFKYDIDDYADENGNLPGNVDEETFITQLAIKSL